MLSQGDRAGFEAWVETTKDQKRLAFHQVQHTSPKCPSDKGSTEAFLECEEGSEFAIYVKDLNTRGKREWRVSTYINGNLILQVVLGYLDYPLVTCDVIYEKYGRKMYSRALRFATSADELDIEGGGRALSKDFGTISVKISGGKSSHYRANQPVKATPLKIAKLDEKAIKIGATVIFGGRELHTEKSADVRWKADAKPKIFYQFTWKYRTREKLIDLRIIDSPNPVPIPAQPRKRLRSATPPPVDEEETSAILENEGKPGIAILAAQAKRLKYLEAELRKAKDKLKTVGAGPAAGTKAAERTNRTEEGEGGHDGVIDLSLDDD